MVSCRYRCSRRLGDSAATWKKSLSSESSRAPELEPPSPPQSISAENVSEEHTSELQSPVHLADLPRTCALWPPRPRRPRVLAPLPPAGWGPRTPHPPPLPSPAEAGG